MSKKRKYDEISSILEMIGQMETSKSDILVKNADVLRKDLFKLLNNAIYNNNLYAVKKILKHDISLHDWTFDVHKRIDQRIFKYILNYSTFNINFRRLIYDVISCDWDENNVLLSMCLKDKRLNVNIIDSCRGDNTFCALKLAYSISSKKFPLILNHPNIDVNLKWANYEPLIFTVINSGDFDTFELLLKHQNIHLNCKNSRDQTILEYLCSNDSGASWIKLLLSYPNISINSNDNTRGYTPLMYACMHKSHDVMELLLNRPDIILSIKDVKKKTVMDHEYIDVKTKAMIFTAVFSKEFPILSKNVWKIIILNFIYSSMFPGDKNLSAFAACMNIKEPVIGMWSRSIRLNHNLSIVLANGANWDDLKSFNILKELENDKEVKKILSTLKKTLERTEMTEKYDSLYKLI